MDDVKSRDSRLWSLAGATLWVTCSRFLITPLRRKGTVQYLNVDLTSSNMQTSQGYSESICVPMMALHLMLTLHNELGIQVLESIGTLIFHLSTLSRLSRVYIYME